MCFVIAGVQPKTRTVDETPQRCPRCGLHQAYVQQVDHYLSLFFIPLLRVKKGEPFLYCRRCEHPVEPEVQRSSARQSLDRTPPICSQCHRPLEAHFLYCPYCGRRQ